MLGLVLFLASVGLQTFQRHYDLKSRRETFHNLDLILSKHIPQFAGISFKGLERLVLECLEARLGPDGALSAVNRVTLREAVEMAREIMRRRPVLLPNEPDDGWAHISYCEYVRRAHLRDIERPAIETDDYMPSPLTGEANVFVSTDSSWSQSGLLLRTALDTLRSQCAARFREHNGVSNKLGQGGKREWFLYWEPFSEPLAHVVTLDDGASASVSRGSSNKNSSSGGKMRIERYEQRQKAIQAIGHVLVLLPFDFMASSASAASAATLTVGSLREAEPLMDLLYCHLLAREKTERVQSDHAASLLAKARSKKEAEEAVAREKAARRAARESNRRRHSLVSSGGSDIQVEAISGVGVDAQGQGGGGGGGGGAEGGKGERNLAGEQQDDLGGAPTESASAAIAAIATAATATATSNVAQQSSPTAPPVTAAVASPAPAPLPLPLPLSGINYRWDLCLPVEPQQDGGGVPAASPTVPSPAADPLGLQRLCLSQCGEHYDSVCRLLVHACQAAYHHSSIALQAVSALSPTNFRPSFHFTIDEVNDFVLKHERIGLFYAATQLNATTSPGGSDSEDRVRLLANSIRGFGNVFIPAVRASTATASSVSASATTDVAAAVEIALATPSAEHDRVLLAQADMLLVRALLGWLSAASATAIQQRSACVAGTATATAGQDKGKDKGSAADADAANAGDQSSAQPLYRKLDCNQNYNKWVSVNKAAISMYRPHGLGMAGGRVLARQFLEQILHELGSRLGGQYVRDERWSSAGYCSDADAGASASASASSAAYVFVQDHVPFAESTHGVTGELLVSPYSVQLHVRLGSMILRLIRSQIERQCGNVLDRLLVKEDPSPLQRLAAIR